MPETAAEAARIEVVIPTIGRPSLQTLIDSLGACAGPPPAAVLLVDDRRVTDEPLRVAAPPALQGLVRVLRGRGAGPAAARNVGWRATTPGTWVAFLDDDVLVPADWLLGLRADLTDLPPDVAGSQGLIRVPLPAGRRPTDWERNVAGLESALYATADLAYRRTALEDVGGFDERFPRAYREDADLALRLLDRGWRIERGRRQITHPVRPADRWISVRLQRGNADDPLMGALHGPGWRDRAGVPTGRRRRHIAITAAGLLALVAAAAGRRATAAAAAAAWLAGTAELAWARIAPGPRTTDEVATMISTSALLPPAATWSWLRGVLGVLRGAAASSHPLAPAPRRTAPPAPRRPRAVLFDRDGTLVEDVPYNGDPDLVELRPGARAAIERLRAAGIATAVISNQSGVARGLINPGQVQAVNARMVELLGPLGPILCCPHGPDDACACRKPAPGLVKQAAAELGVDPADCVVIGDIGSDVDAALAAGARAILVPTPRTLPEEVYAAPEVAADLLEAVARVLDGAPGQAPVAAVGGRR